jgi:hypothetical protein
MKYHIPILLVAIVATLATISFYDDMIIPQASAQTVESAYDHVVINEVESNPTGNDYFMISEWVEIYNPTDSHVDVSGWQIVPSTTPRKTFTIAEGIVMPPDSLLVFQYVKGWFNDHSEIVTLLDNTGNVIDSTPTLSDKEDNFKSWQRLYDGYDTDAEDDWHFTRSTTGSSNGKIDSTTTTSTISLYLESDKSQYVFGQTAIIRGNVSEKIYVEKPFFHPEEIKLTISGPEYYKETLLYPDPSLMYESTFQLKKIIGINAGVYTVTATYAGQKQTIQFTVGDQSATNNIQNNIGNLSIATDKYSYIPGDSVKIFAKTSKIIPLEGLKFKVSASDKSIIHSGTLFPNLHTRTTTTNNSPSIYDTAQFSTEIFLSPVNPKFGTFIIDAEYAEQHATNTFTISEDIRDDSAISLSSDKPVYGLGETVTIHGRLNHVWIPTIDLEIKQITTDKPNSAQNLAVSVKPILDVQGDGRFSYQLNLGTTELFTGEYLVKASKEIGSAQYKFRVVANPDDYVEGSDAPLVLKLDKATYAPGDTMMISGRVNELQTNSQFYTSPVTFRFYNADEGGSINSITHSTRDSKVQEISVSLTAVPDRAGNFHVEDTLHEYVYSEGNYIIRASYADSPSSIFVPFSIVDPDKIDDVYEININKNIFGFGETVQVDGLLPGISQGSGIVIRLIKPSGNIDEFGVLVDGSRFSWSWQTPIQEHTQNIQKSDGRTVKKTNLGIYQLDIKTDLGDETIFFKLSRTPDTDYISDDILSIETDKETYAAGTKLLVTGVAQNRVQGSEGLVVPDRVKLVVETMTFPIVKIHETFVYFDRGGIFESTFDLPITQFAQGTYKVKAYYFEHRASTTFNVTNPYILGSDQELELILSLDKEEYHPGDMVQITGHPTRVISATIVDITVSPKSLGGVACDYLTCAPLTNTMRVSTEPSGYFSSEYMIDDSDDVLGTYEVKASTEFGDYSLPFRVVEMPVIIPKEEPTQKNTSSIMSDNDTITPLRFTEKFNRITSSDIQIALSEITPQNSFTTLNPRVIQGSLLAPTPGDEVNVNLEVIAPNGQCIIGQQEQCEIKESTRAPGMIYGIVEIDGINYNVRYSGHDTRIEKFTILPTESGTTLDHLTWDINILKSDYDNQKSRFYYKITYVN